MLRLLHIEGEGKGATEHYTAVGDSVPSPDTAEIHHLQALHRTLVAPQK